MSVKNRETTPSGPINSAPSPVESDGQRPKHADEYAVSNARERGNGGNDDDASSTAGSPRSTSSAPKTKKLLAANTPEQGGQVCR